MLFQILLYHEVNQLYVYIYSLLLGPPSHPHPIPPIQVTTEHRADLLVLYSRFPLAIYFIHGSVYMSIPISQFTLPPLPLCVHMSILYVCVSIPALKISSSLPFFLDSTYMCQYTIFVFLFLTSFCMTHSRCIHISTNYPTAFVYLHTFQGYGECLLKPYRRLVLYLDFFIHSSSLSIHLSVDIQIASMSWLS